MTTIRSLPEELYFVLFGHFVQSSLIMFCLTNKKNYLLANRYGKSNEIPRELDIHKVVSEGSLGIIQWAHQNGHLVYSDICRMSAEEGQWKILKWAKQHSYPWNFHTCSGAAKGGHFGILKWARQNGCKWNSDTCSGAARGGPGESGIPSNAYMHSEGSLRYIKVG